MLIEILQQFLPNLKPRNIISDFYKQQRKFIMKVVIDDIMITDIIIKEEISWGKLFWKIPFTSTEKNPRIS